MGIKSRNFLLFQNPISILITIIFIFGVDLRNDTRRPGNKVSKLCTTYQRIVGMAWFVFLAHVTATFIKSDMISYEEAKGMLSRKLTDVNAFAVWAALVVRRNSISATIKDIFLLPSVTIRRTHVCASLIAVLGIPVIAWLSMTVPFKEPDCLPLVMYFSLGTSTVPEGQNCSVMYPMMLAYNLAIYTLRTALAALYVLLCCSVRGVINRCTNSVANKLNNSKIRLRDIQGYFAKYNQAIRALKSLEKSMSFPIFLLQISDLLGMFAGFVRLDPLGQRQNKHLTENYRLGIVFVVLRALLSFLFVSLTASSVHEADKEAKEVSEEVMKRVQSGRSSKDFEKITSLCILNLSHPFALSAGGYFYFTKGLVLSALGSVLTYSLLILQINFV